MAKTKTQTSLWSPGRFAWQFLPQFFAGDSLRAQLLRGGVGSLAIKTAHAGLAFLLAVVLARELGPEGYGVYSFALAILMITAIPAQAGIPQLVVRETAKAQANKDWGLMCGLWRWANLEVIVFSIIGALVVGGILPFMGGADDERVTTVAIGIALIPLIALANVRAACLRGLRMVVWGQLPERVFRPALLLVLVGGWIIILGTRGGPSAWSVMGLHVIAAGVSFAVGGLMLWMARPENMKRRPVPSYQSSSWHKAVIPLAMITGLQMINNYADLIILGIFRSNEEVGIYRAVFQVALLVIFGLQAINQVLHPHFARLYLDGAHEKLQRLVTISSRAILGLALPPALLFIIFGDDVLRLIFGDPFLAGRPALAILVAGQLVNASLGSVGALLNMTGHERDTMNGMIVAMVVNVGLNLVLAPLYGMAGAAAATATSVLVWNILLRKAVLKRLLIESSALGLKNSRSGEGNVS
jgi:O-antigen/teichoic acid export membrane protein